MKYLLSVFTCLACMTCILPVQAQQTNRAAYPGSIPVVMCEPLYVCTIQLQPHDLIAAIAAGDTARWIVTQVRANDTPVILVKPRESNLRTNLIVATASRLYYVTLVSRAGAGPGRLIFYTRAQSHRPAPATRSATASPPPTPSPTPTPDLAYHMTGDRSFAPQNVYNDGQHTYLLYEKIPEELPVAVAVSAGGDQLVNFRFQNGMFVIDGVPDQIDLVLHAGTGRRDRGERRLHIFYDGKHSGT